MVGFCPQMKDICAGVSKLEAQMKGLKEGTVGEKAVVVELGAVVEGITTSF